MHLYCMHAGLHELKPEWKLNPPYGRIMRAAALHGPTRACEPTAQREERHSIDFLQCLQGHDWAGLRASSDSLRTTMHHSCCRCLRRVPTSRQPTRTAPSGSWPSIHPPQQAQQAQRTSRPSSRIPPPPLQLAWLAGQLVMTPGWRPFLCRSGSRHSRRGRRCPW